MAPDDEHPKPGPAEEPPPDESPAESAPKSVIRRSLFIGVCGSVIGSFFFPLVMGDIFNRYIIAMGFKSRAGLFMAVASLAAATQIFGSWVLQRTGHRRLFFFALLGPPRLIWLAIITVPLWGPRSDMGRLVVMLLLYGLFWVTSGVGGIAWIAWMRDLVPEGYRGRFFAFRQEFMTIVMTLWGLFASYYIQSKGVTRDSFVPVYFFAVACGVLDIVLHIWVWHPPMKTKKGSEASLRRMLSSAAHPGLRRYLAVLVVWCFSTSMGGLCWLHMWTGMGVEVFDVTAMGALGMVVYLIFVPLWGYFLDHNGVKATYLTSMILTVTTPFLLTQAPRFGWSILCVSVVLGRIAWAGLGLATTNMVFSLARREDQAMSSAIVAVVAGLVGAASYALSESLLFPLFRYLGTLLDSGPLFYVVAAYLVAGVLRAVAVLLATRLDQPGHEVPAGVVVKLFYTTNPVRALYSLGRFVTVKAGDLVTPREKRDTNHSGRFRMD